MDCGGCTLCCKLLETHGVQSQAGEYCSKCSPGVGCKIHKMRPKECRDYDCMWVQMKEVGQALRPDRSHIIFEKVTDTIICGLQDPDFGMTYLAEGQIGSFNRQGFSVGLINGRSKGVYLAKGHTRLEVGGVLNDRSELYRRLIRL